MRGFWAGIKIGWLNNLTYRWDFVLWSIAEVVESAVMLVVWVVVMADRPVLAGFDQKDTVTYFVFWGLFGVLTSTWIGGKLSGMIQTGNLNGLLLRPMSPLVSLYSQFWGNLAMDLVLRLAVYVAMVGLFWGYLVKPSSWGVVVLALAALVVGTMWTYFLDLVMGCLAFWTVKGAGVFSMRGMLQRVLGGGYAPLDFFPKWLQTVAWWLPFGYQRYFAIMIYLEKLTPREIGWGFLMQIGWLGVTYFVFRILWRKGLRQYEGVGV